jgi:hypothetical protein
MTRPLPDAEALRSEAADVVDLCQLWRMLEGAALASLSDHSPQLGPTSGLGLSAFVEVHLRMAAVADNPHLSHVLETTLRDLVPSLRRAHRHSPELFRTDDLVAAFLARDAAACLAILEADIARLRNRVLDLLGS